MSRISPSLYGGRLKSDQTVYTAQVLCKLENNALNFDAVKLLMNV